MGAKGVDFKHKEVIDITDGRRLRIRTRCNSRFRKWDNHIYNGCKKENRYSRFVFEREQARNGYMTMQGEKRTGYVVRDTLVYDVACKVEM